MDNKDDWMFEQHSYAVYMKAKYSSFPQVNNLYLMQLKSLETFHTVSRRTVMKYTSFLQK